jgi:hypothetical protein
MRHSALGTIAMKPFLMVLLLVELLIAYFLLGPECAYRKQQRVAFAVWVQKRTPEARAELERQRRISQWYSVGASAVVFGVMAVPTVLLSRAWARRHPAAA